jgi:hypothetical protein
VRRLPPEQPSDDGPEELLRGTAFAIDVSPKSSVLAIDRWDKTTLYDELGT